MTCAECGAELAQSATGRPRTYCSVPCRRLAERKLKVAEQLLARARREEQKVRGLMVTTNNPASRRKEAEFWAGEAGRCEAALAALLRGAGEDDGSGEAERTGT